MLTARQMEILKSIIYFYTNDGEAVGSKTIANNTPIQASPATIRNEMSVLEKAGYIKKPHQSSGRVPSIKGYRFYLDHLVKPEVVSKETISKISNSLSTRAREIDDLVHQSAQVLSELTNYTAIVLGPKVADSRLTDFRLVMINAYQVMAIMETNHHTIKSIVFRPSYQVSRSDIDRLSKLLNQELVGHLLTHVLSLMKEEIPLLVRRHFGDVGPLLQSVQDSLMQANQNQLHVSGKNNLFDLTDELSVDQLKALFDLLDNQEYRLSQLFYNSRPGISIKLGGELEDERFNNLSLITADYSVGNFGQGVIAILGPTYMPYSKTLGLLEGFRGELADVLLNYYIK